jgi:hypothetical protein
MGDALPSLNKINAVELDDGIYDHLCYQEYGDDWYLYRIKTTDEFSSSESESESDSDPDPDPDSDSDS